MQYETASRFFGLVNGKENQKRKRFFVIPLVFGMMETAVSLLSTVVATHIGAVCVAAGSGVAGIPMRAGGTVIAEFTAGQDDFLSFVFLFHDLFLLCYVC